MTEMVPLVVLYALVIPQVVSRVLGLHHEANIEYYKPLCDLYGIGTAADAILVPFEAPQDRKVDAKMQEIEKLFTLINPEEAKKAGVPNEILTTIQNWSGDGQTPDSEEGLKFKTLKLSDREAKFFGSKMKALYLKAKTLAEKVKADDGEIRINISKIMPSLKKAALGEKSNHDTAAPADTTRGNACGKEQDKPGKTLANDIACLCIPNSSYSNSGKLCGPDIGGSSKSWSDIQSAGILAVAEAKPLLDKCKFEQATESLPQKIDALLRNFTALLGSGDFKASNAAGVGTHRRYNYGYGSSSADGTCNGGSDGNLHDFCVNYAKVVTGNGGLQGIQWYAAFSKASQDLREIELHQKSSAAAEKQIGELQEKSWEVYEEARFTAEGHPFAAATKPSGAGPIVGVAGDPAKGTAQDPTAVSATIRPRLILPWTLFI